MTFALKSPIQENRLPCQDRIDEEIQQIVSLILQGLPKQCEPVSIVWHGSFARGESGMYSYWDRQLPFGDYDFRVVCRAVPGRETIQRIEKSIEAQLQYRPVTAPVQETLAENANSYNVLDLNFCTVQQFLSLSPDLSTYDLVHSSQVVYGEDLRPHIDLDINQVPLFSVYRILNNRLFHLMGLFNLDLWDPELKLTHQQRVAFSLAVCRLWLDFGTALCVCLGVYAPDYRTRLENLCREGDRVKTWFRDWEGLLEGIRVAADFKADPRPAQLDSESIRRGYFKVLHAWDRVMRVVQNNLMPYYYSCSQELSRVDYWCQSAEVCMKILPRRYYRDYLSAIWKRQGRPPRERLLSVMGRLANVHENHVFRGVPFLLLHPKMSLVSPEIVYFATLPLLTFSLTNTRKVHYGMLNHVMKMVSPYKKCDIALVGREGWQMVKDYYVDLFSEYRRRKGGSRHLPKWLSKK